MSLADKLKEPPRTVKGPKCGVARLLRTLEGDELAAFTNALSTDSGWPSTQLSRALRDEGVNLSHFSIQRHRRRECNCFS